MVLICGLRLVGQLFELYCWVKPIYKKHWHIIFPSQVFDTIYRRSYRKLGAKMWHMYMQIFQSLLNTNQSDYIFKEFLSQTPSDNCNKVDYHMSSSSRRNVVTLFLTGFSTLSIYFWFGFIPAVWKCERDLQIIKHHLLGSR